jgi:hypothetical protein
VALGIVVEKRTDRVVRGTVVGIRLALVRSNAGLFMARCFCPFTACAYISSDFVASSEMPISPTRSFDIEEGTCLRVLICFQPMITLRNKWNSFPCNGFVK